MLKAEKKIRDLIKIRLAVPEDLEQITAVESAAFPPEEGASEEAFRWRLEHLKDSFFVAEQKGEKENLIVGLIDGRPTDHMRLYDDIYENGGSITGKNQVVMGLAVLPEYQSEGIGSRLMGIFINKMKTAGYRHIILSCKEDKIGYYEQFGYENKGISASVHGGVRWYDMIRRL